MAMSDIRMSNAFDLPISCEEVAEIGTEIFLGNEDAYVAHAINQHDKLTDRVKELETSVVFLWKLLDNISTAGDAFKPEITEYFEYVESQCSERSKVAVSDGYSLFDSESGQEIGASDD